MSNYEDFPMPTEFRDKLLAELALSGGVVQIEDVVVEVEIDDV